MATAKVRLRIKSVKYEGFTFQQQADWWRAVIKTDRRHAGDGLFLPWVRANWDALKLTMEDQHKGRYPYVPPLSNLIYKKDQR